MNNGLYEISDIISLLGAENQEEKAYLRKLIIFMRKGSKFLKGKKGETKVLKQTKIHLIENEDYIVVFDNLKYLYTESGLKKIKEKSNLEEKRKKMLWELQ